MRDMVEQLRHERDIAIKRHQEEADAHTQLQKDVLRIEKEVRDVQALQKENRMLSE